MCLSLFQHFCASWIKKPGVPTAFASMLTYTTSEGLKSLNWQFLLHALEKSFSTVLSYIQYKPRMSVDSCIHQKHEGIVFT